MAKTNTNIKKDSLIKYKIDSISSAGISTMQNMAVWGNIWGVEAGFSGILPNPDPILKKLGISESVHADIAANSHVMSCISSRKSRVLSFEWKLQQGDASDDEYSLVTELFNIWPVSELIEQALEAPFYGYQPFELNWINYGNYWIPLEIISKPRTWFSYNKEGELKLLSRTSGYSGEVVPEYKFVVVRNKPTYDNPYGQALLSWCYWPNYIQQNGKQNWLVYSEKYGMPLIDASYDPDRLAQAYETSDYDDAATKFKDVLANAVRDAVIVHPEGTVINSLISGSSSNSEIFKDLIKQGQEDISKVILGHSAAADSTSNKLGSESTAMTVRGDITESDKKMVESFFNKLLKWIAALNFNNDK